MRHFMRRKGAGGKAFECADREPRHISRRRCASFIQQNHLRKELTLYGLFAVMLAGLAAPLQAKDKDHDRRHDDRHHHHGYRPRVDPTRVVWVIDAAAP
jgi:hypothetical protein